MAVILDKYKIAYFPVPKTACTSLKMLMYELNNGQKFEMREENGVVLHIHNSAYGTPYFNAVDHASLLDMIRIAVIREPIARMLSAYSNRVIFHGELAKDRIDVNLAAQLGVHPDPSPDHFFNQIDKFRVLSDSIRHHTDLVTSFLGPDLGYYHRVFRLEEINSFVEMLSSIVGYPVELGREQVGGEKIKFSELKENTRRNLLAYCYPDFALMRGYYWRNFSEAIG